MMLGWPSGQRLLRDITEEEFLEWRVYLMFEPPLEERVAPLFASVRHTLAEQWRDHKRRPQPYKLEDFMLRFGDEKPQGLTRGRMTWQEQKKMLFQYSQELARAQSAAAAKRGHRA